MLLKDFSYYLKVERQMSGNTIESYCSDVSSFLEFCGGDPLALDSDAVSSYLGSRYEKLSKRSQARALSSLNSFFNWLVLEGYRADNPCDGVDAPKLGRYLPDVLSEAEVTAIMALEPFAAKAGRESFTARAARPRMVGKMDIAAIRTPESKEARWAVFSSLAVEKRETISGPDRKVQK